MLPLLLDRMVFINPCRYSIKLDAKTGRFIIRGPKRTPQQAQKKKEEAKLPSELNKEKVYGFCKKRAWFSGWLKLTPCAQSGQGLGCCNITKPTNNLV